MGGWVQGEWEVLSGRAGRRWADEREGGRGRGKERLADPDCHLHSGALPAWDYEGKMVCSAGGLGQQVGVHRYLVPGLGGLP